MPVEKKKDKKGMFFQYGQTGTKYYYDSKKSEERAFRKAQTQERAIKASGYKEE